MSTAHDTVSAHTPGKLIVRSVGRLAHITTEDDADGYHRIFADIYETSVKTGEPDRMKNDAARFVACWNACEGINPEAVKELLEACKELLEVINHPNADIPDSNLNKKRTNAQAAIERAENRA